MSKAFEREPWLDDFGYVLTAPEMRLQRNGDKFEVFAGSKPLAWGWLAVSAAVGGALGICVGEPDAREHDEHGSSHEKTRSQRKLKLTQDAHGLYGKSVGSIMIILGLPTCVGESVAEGRAIMLIGQDTVSAKARRGSAEAN